jgi:hypothetical protein
MRKLLLGLSVICTVSASAETTICTALCHKSWASFGYSETGNKFVPVIGKGFDEASATAELASKCKKYDKESRPVKGISTSNSHNSDYVSVSIVEASNFSCINL